MTDNEGEEPIETPVNTPLENPPGEMIPAKENEPVILSAETDNMEVHHHAHHEGKKNWKSYAWEFLMLFFAVFFGFLAQNFLEHRLENEKAAHARLDDLPLFAVMEPPAPPAKSVIDEAVAALDPDALTPREALEALYRLTLSFSASRMRSSRWMFPYRWR